MRTTRTGSVLLLAALAVGVAACSPSGTASSSSLKSSGAVSSGAVSTGAVSTGAVAASPAMSSGAVAPTSGSADRAPATAGVEAATIGATVAPATADIVENGRLDVRLGSPATLRSAYRAIQAMAGAAGGFIADSTLTDARVPTASLTLRVPEGGVAAVTDRIAALGVVTTQTMSGQDVTGQVVDLSVEITNLTSEEAAVRHLLADAGSVRNILTVQQQLFSLQDEIQQLTAQSNSLADRVRYATIAVALSTRMAATPPRRRPTTTLARFAHLAGSHTVGLVRGVVLAVGWSAPGLVLLLLGGGALVAVRHRRRGRGPASAPAP